MIYSYRLPILLFFSIILSDFVSIDDAKKVANNVMALNYSDETFFNIESVHNITDNSTTLIYAINYTDKGFVLVSADDRVNPLLGYSFNNKFLDSNLPIQLKDMIFFYKRQTTKTKPIS